MLAPVTLVVTVAPLSVILDVTSSGAVVLEPLIANTEITCAWALERVIVTVCPVPTFAAFAYQI